VQICPKHRDARERALEVAKIITDHAEMKRHVLEKKELPLKDLESLVQVSRKTLERQRKYIFGLSSGLIRAISLFEKLPSRLIGRRSGRCKKESKDWS